jgi:hypothetical protein
MSSYVSKQAAARASMTAQLTARIGSTAQSMVKAMVDGLNSLKLSESAAELAEMGTTGLPQVQAMAVEELNVLPVDALSPDLAADIWDFREGLAQAVMLPEGAQGGFAESAAGELAGLIDRAATEVGAAERVITAEAYILGLADLDYTIISSATGEFTNAIEAARGHEKVVIRVTDGGTVDTEWVGLADNSCQDREAELNTAVEKHGVSFGEAKVTMYYDPRGGKIIANAAQHATGSLAKDVVTEAERDGAPARKRTRYGATSRSRRRVRG